ncbi:DUF4255 domain-containing protein [Pseudomaricurvus alcaniphilus]|uniref:DUF4255 domain-containing protein n=1 Tax=Pseudomaricurvus alcaniphilus TaxID=1166482 RepID=UPI00140770D4|nr:DUF4255 domain-containing protein [Pseudomaricurvus alcaniphilus]NHN38318.1 DUF4255 domain-containing protein [Pseudomaricurvus alcaniphilus]
MADHSSIAAVSSSLVRYFDYCFRERQPINSRTTAVRLARTEDLDTEVSQLIQAPCLAVFLYRVDFNKTMRAAWSALASNRGESHLPLDLHYLIIAFGENADHEHRIIGRAMQCMENRPILSGPMLDPITNWASNESIQVCLEDLSTEDVMRTFDSLPLDYKLSIPYVARIAVISDRLQQEPPVTHTSVGARPTTVGA